MPTSLQASGSPSDPPNTATLNDSTVTPGQAATDLFADLGLNQFTGGGGGLPAPQKPAVPSSSAGVPLGSQTQQSKTDVTYSAGVLSMQDKHR